MNEFYSNLFSKKEFSKKFKEDGIISIDELYYEIKDLLKTINGIPYYNDKEGFELDLMYNFLSLNLLIISQKSSNLHTTNISKSDFSLIECNDCWIKYTNRVLSTENNFFSNSVKINSQPINLDVSLFLKLIFNENSVERNCVIYELILMRCLFLLNSEQTKAALDICQALHAHAICHREKFIESDLIGDKKIDLVEFFDFRFYSTSHSDWMKQIDNFVILAFQIIHCLNNSFENESQNYNCTNDKSLIHALLTYIKAFNYISFGQAKDSLDSIFNDLSALVLNKNVPLFLKLNIRLLMSRMLLLKENHHLSIEVLKLNLKDDAFCMRSLLELSLQFNHLNLIDAELKILNLISKQADKQNKSKGGKGSFLMDFLVHLMPKYFPVVQPITKVQIILYHASRLYQMKRYEEAIPFYIEVVDGSSEINESVFGVKMTLNDYRIMYSNIIACFIETSRFEEANKFCMKAREKLASHHEETMDSCKRPMINEDQKLFEVNIEQLMSQIHFLTNMKSEALTMITSAINNLESICIEQNAFKNSKKIKLENVEVVSDEAGNNLKLLASMYSDLSSFLADSNDLKSALDAARKSFHLDSSNVELAINLYSMLIKMNMKREATIGWIKYRKIKCDKENLDNISSKNLSKNEECLIDIESLKYFLQNENQFKCMN